MRAHNPGGQAEYVNFAVMAGVYLHIPFCRQACHYCDFHFSTRQETKEELIHAIGDELRLQRAYLPDHEAIRTIYFGGGTPSLLTEKELHQLVASIHSSFSVIPDAEVTLEANPDDLSAEKLSLLRAHGVNRLSIGIQSFDDSVLRSLNRAHDRMAATQCIADARAAGFNNLSIDLMYALPGQSQDDWKKNIAEALALAPEHISAYSLTVEPKTVFGKWQRMGKLHAPDDEAAAQQFEILMDMLGAAGYEHYEISNFCRPGFHSRHNSSYWNQEVYLGVGPSAHSFDRTSRQWNISNNAQYVQSLRKGIIPFGREVLLNENKINEYIFTSLRTSAGCDLQKIKYLYDHDLSAGNADYLHDLQERNLATVENSVLRLTRSGKLLADKIASDLFTEVNTDL